MLRSLRSTRDLAMAGLSSSNAQAVRSVFS